MAERVHTITRAEILEIRALVGFSPLRRPTYDELANFLELADPGSTLPDPELAQVLLEQFTADHISASQVIEAAIRSGASTAQLQAPDGPYLHLAEAIGGLLATFVLEQPFGANSCLAGLVFAEHILEMHGITASLSNSPNELRGGVLEWCSRLESNEPTSHDPCDGLVRAILGRFRFKLP